MARNALHSPFAQQHTSNSSSTAYYPTSSRVSPFQQAAAALHGFDGDDVEAAWSGSGYDLGLRQRYLDVLEPVGPTTRQSSISSRSNNGSGAGASSNSSSSARRDQDQQPHTLSRTLSAAAPVSLRLMVNGDVLATTTTTTITSSSRPFGAHGSSSGGVFGGGGGGFPPPPPHTIRTRAVLFSSASAEPHTPSAHTTTSGLSRLHSASNTHSSSSAGSSSSGSSGGSSVARSRTLRRLQHRSSSLLAATSATASSVWSSLSALGDRSRSLLCRNTPVAHSSGSSNGSSVGDIGGVDEGAVGVGVFMPMAAAVGIERDIGAGSSSSSTAGSSSFARAPRLPQRLLSRSTAIRRSAARGPAVLIDIDATDSYDDLLALDQFNVKRAVKASVLRGLPCRAPDTADEQQQRQCHICLQAWLPPQRVAAGDAAASTTGAAGAAAVKRTGQQPSGHCCSCRCALQQQQEQQWLVPQLSGLLQGQQQQQHLQLVCWEGPSGPQGVIVPAPAPARLLQGGSSTQEGGGGSPLSTPADSSGSSSGGSSARDGVSVTVGVGSLSGPRVGVMRVGQRQVGSSRVDAAGSGSPGVQPAAAAVTGHSSLINPTSSSSGEQCCERCCGRVAATGGSGGAATTAAVGVGRDQRSAAVVQIQQLPCGHEFCSGCISTWLRDHISCPVCRWCFPECDTRLININK